MKDFAEFKSSIMDTGKYDEWFEASNRDLFEKLDAEVENGNLSAGEKLWVYVRVSQLRTTFYLLNEYHKWLNE